MPVEALFRYVRYGKDHGTLRLTSKHVIFQKLSQNGDQPKALKLSWTQIAKCPVSPEKHPKALLRVVSHANKSKTFEFDNRTELLKARRYAQQQLRELQGDQKKTGSGVSDGKVKDATRNNTIEEKNTIKTENEQSIPGLGVDEKEKLRKKQSTISDPKESDAETTDSRSGMSEVRRIASKSSPQLPEDLTEKAKAGDKPSDEVEPFQTKQEIKMGPNHGSVDAEEPGSDNRRQKCLSITGRAVRPTLTLVVAILWLIFNVASIRSCFMFQVQLMNLKTKEAIEETMRGYGYFVREVEPGQVPDYGICVGYTPIEENETFNDTWFSAGKAFAQLGLITGVLFCGSSLLLVFPVVPFPYFSRQRLLVFLFCVSLMSQGLQFLVFGTQFCATHICKGGPGTASACVAFFCWMMLGFVVSVPPLIDLY